MGNFGSVSSYHGPGSARSRRERIENSVKIVGAVCAVLTLVLGAYKVSFGPDSIDAKLRQTSIQSKMLLCAEAVDVVGKLATSIADSAVAGEVKTNFRQFYNGRISLLGQPAIDALFSQVHQRYQDEEHNEGAFGADRSKEEHTVAYKALEADLRRYASSVAAQCDKIED